MKKIIAAAICVALLSGCATTSGLKPETSISKFDNSRVVHIEPHGTWCGMRMTPCAMVGAEWNSAHPDVALVQIEMMWEYTNINAAEVNIDGHITHLEISHYTTQFNNPDPGSPMGALLRTSDQMFVAPMSLVREMASAKDVRLRVDTSKGYDDGIINSAEHDSKAFYALQRFVSAVDNP